MGGGRRLGRRGRRSKQFLLGRFYLNPGAQYSTTVISAILLSAFVFSGFLLFRFSDTQDLVMRGKRLMAQGKVAWAAKTFENLVNRHPNQYEGHLLLGQAYLQLGERTKAEQEFLTASALHTGKDGKALDNHASLALTKLAIARKNYKDAETQLLRIQKQNPKDLEVRQALFDLYQDWAQRLVEDQKPLEQALSMFEKAGQYASDYDQLEKLKDPWLDAIHHYALEQDKQKHYDKVLVALQRSLKLRYDPEVLIQVAEAFEKKSDLDDAILWYRKAFDANPAVISLKLSSLLVKKGQLLAQAHQTDAAEKYFAEAKQVSSAANIPLESIFPVTLSNVDLQTHTDAETGEVQTEYHVTFENGAASKPLPFLLARAQFYANDQLMADVRHPVASPENPLPVKGSGKKTLVFAPTESLNLYQLEDKPLMVKLSIAYSEGDHPSWKFLKATEVAIKKPEGTDLNQTPESAH